MLIYAQQKHIAEVNPILLRSWVIPIFIALMSYTESLNIVELYPVLLRCRTAPYPITMFW